MRNSNRNAFVARSTRVVRGALIAIFGLAVLAGYSINAVAQNTESSLTKPVSKVEAGVGIVSDGSFKFGEYNGLQNQGAVGISAFDFRGGAAYDSGSTWRWRLMGTNLGLETRNLFAEIGEQGKFRFTFTYDELLANRSDTNQTMFLGAGTNALTLPANWVKPTLPQLNTNINFRSFDPIAGTSSYISSAGVLTAPTAAQLAALANIRATDIPDFYNVDLATKRTLFGGGFSYSPNENWDVPLSFTHEHKQGRKALGAVSSLVNENAVILPDLIDYNTDQANAAITYKLKRGFVSFGYYGSFFDNGVKSMSWQDPSDISNRVLTMGSMPSNQFHQFSLTSGFKLSSNTKLVVNGSYGRNTQNDAFVDPSTAINGQLAWGLPVSSLKGLVVTSAFNAKLTSKPTKKLNLSAAYKFDNRDNQTPVNTYLFQDANEASSGVSRFAGLNGLPANLGNNTNIYDNRAYSRQLNQANLQSEYAIAKKQYLTGGYDWQRIARSCSGAWINCADAPVTNEHTLRGEWRKSVGDLSAKLSYGYSWRRGKYDENAFLALVPMADVVPTGATMSAYDFMTQNGLTGFGPMAGLPTTPLTGDAAVFTPNNNIVQNAYYGSRNNINELVGMRRYFVADRNRHKVRSNIDWQATQKFSVQATGEYNNDDYLNSVYGLKKGTFWQATADLSYAASENFVVDLFYTYDNQRFLTAGDAYGSNSTAAFQGKAGDTLVAGSCFSTVAAKNASAKVDPCLNWSKDSRDKIDTVGFSIRRKNLAANKLELATEVMFMRARTNTAVGGGSYVNNPYALAGAPVLPAGTPAVYLIAASDYPVLRNDELMVRPTVTYAFSKAASFRFTYMFQRLMPTDWAYMGLQYGTGSNYVPTNEQLPSYGVHYAGVSVIYTF